MEVVQVERTIRQKRVDIGSRVSGCFGELFDAGTGHKRRHRQRLNGTVLSAVGTKEYQVKFDDGSIRVVYSNQLRVESAIDSLPPDLRPASQAPAQDANNDSDYEHLPAGDEPDEDGELEADEEEAAGGAEATGGAESQTGNFPVGSLVIGILIKQFFILLRFFILLKVFS